MAALKTTALLTILLVSISFAAEGFGEFSNAYLKWSPSKILQPENTQTLYGVTAITDELITIDTETGAGALVGPLGVDIGYQGASFHQDGTFYGLFWTEKSQDYRLYSLDLVSGAATEVGPLNLGLEQEGTDLAVDPAGNLIGVVGTSVILIDRYTGEGEIIFNLPEGFSLPGLDYSPEGVLYAIGAYEGAWILGWIDVQGLSFHEIGPTTYHCTSLCFNDNGTLYGGAEFSPYKLTVIDTVTAQQTIIGDIGFEYVSGMDFTPGVTLEILYSLPYARPGYLTWWKPLLINGSDADVTVSQVQLEVSGPVSATLTLWSGSLTLPAGTQVSAWIDLLVPDITPLGEYTFETVVEFSDGGFVTSMFEIEVVE